jgi:outer membrane murein-binding lipoprotein Lpp
MAKKDQLEKDYESLNRKIEQAAEEEIKKIQEKIEALKKEARQMGETVELTLAEKEPKATKKKH